MHLHLEANVLLCNVIPGNVYRDPGCRTGRGTMVRASDFLEVPHHLAAPSTTAV